MMGCYDTACVYQLHITDVTTLKEESMTKVRLYALGTSTTLESNKSDLDTYLSVREALGLQIRVERTLLRDFVQYVEHASVSGPIRAQLAVDWACASSSTRGASGASQRLSMVRGFLAYLRATLPETEVPAHDIIASARRPSPRV